MGSMIEQHEWRREGYGEIHFSKKTFPVIGAVHGKTGAFNVTDGSGKVVPMYLGEREKETNPDTGTSYGCLVILVDSPSGESASETADRWRERVRAGEAASDQSYWDSPEGRAEAARFEED